MEMYGYDNSFEIPRYDECLNLDLDAKNPNGTVANNFLLMCLILWVNAANDLNYYIQMLLTPVLLAFIPFNFIYHLRKVNDTRDGILVAFSLHCSIVAAHWLFGIKSLLYYSVAMTFYILGVFIMAHGDDILIMYRVGSTARVRLGVDDIDTPSVELPVLFALAYGSVSMLSMVLRSEVRDIAFLFTIWAIMDCCEVAINLILLGMENHLIYQMSPLRRRWG